MVTGNLFRVEIVAGVAQRRRIAIRLGVTLLLAAPFVAVRMPAGVRVSGLLMVILFTTLLGSAVAHERLQSSGRMEKLILLPVPRCLLWLDLVLAWSVLRFAPLALVLLAFAWVQGPAISGPALLVVYGGLACALVVLGALGLLVGRLARGGGEVHLFGALAVMLVALVSGLVPLPGRLAWLRLGWMWNPVRALAELLTALPERDPGMAGAAVSSLVVIASLVAWRWTAGGAGGPARRMGD